jgi:RNA polymerase sigma-70 factor, ECF subfamily
MADATDDGLQAFESQRTRLVALAYRMLGDLGRAEDMVQEAWLRWQGRQQIVDSPAAYLVTMVTRLCLNELDSAKTRREQSRGDRLPEPVALEEGALGRIEALEQISMAFLVMLQRLSPAERAVLLLHDVFDFAHAEIATLVDKNEAACRKLLERAHQHVASEKRLFVASSRETHQRLLTLFIKAASAGDTNALVELLAEDAVLITDGGPDGRRGRGFRNLRLPLQGAAKIAAFIVATARNAGLEAEMRELNGQPAIVLYDKEKPSGALLLGVANGHIHRVFFHADTTRLQHVGPRARKSPPN